MIWDIKVVVILGLTRVIHGDFLIGCTWIGQFIDCSSRHLTNFPPDNYFQLHDETIDIPLLPEENMITDLNLANNKLEEWQGVTISNIFPNIMSLDLSMNKISKVTNIKTILLHQKLLHLKLSANPISDLGNDTETVLYSLSISHLDISNCYIESITAAESLNFLNNLTHLNLSGNPLFVIDNLQSMTLINLDLSNCQFGVYEKGIRVSAFRNLPKLKKLNISKNVHLTKFSSPTTLSRSLLHLDASNCAFEKTDLRPFPNLQQVKLRGNAIKILKNGVLSHNGNLIYLDISENSINHIEERAFEGCNSLKILDLSQNILKKINWNVFINTPKLENLTISRNLLTFLDELPIQSLIFLDVSRCEISDVSPRLLIKAQELKYLDLSHNFIEKMPQKLSSKKLISLDLSFCRILNLKHESFQDLSSLQKLNLMGNRLTNPLSQNLINNFENIKELNLLDNPWHCVCSDPEFRKMWQYFSTNPKRSGFLKKLLCYSPKENSGISWEKSCFKTLYTNEKQKTRVWFSFLVPFLTICCLLAVFMVVRQAYVSNSQVTQQRELSSQGTGRDTETRENLLRVNSHFFDNDFERGIQQSLSETTQRSPVHDLSKLPSYEEALLLPKLLRKEELKNIMRNYEEQDQFEMPITENANPGNREHNYSFNSPSTSRLSTAQEDGN